MKTLTIELHPGTFYGHGRTMRSCRDEQVVVTFRSLLPCVSLRYLSSSVLALIASVPVLLMASSTSSVPVVGVTGIGVLTDRYTQTSRRAEVAAV